MKSTFLLLLAAALLLIFVSAYFVFEQRIFVMTTRATDSTISPENPYVFASPSCAPADGVSVIRGNVFCLNKRGYPVANLQVRVENSKFANKDQSSLSVEAIQSLTDASGKALFHITSSQVGLHDLDVYCGDVELKAKLKLCFN